MTSGMLAQTREELSEQQYAALASLDHVDFGAAACATTSPRSGLLFSAGLQGFVERAVVPRLHQALETRLARPAPLVVRVDDEDADNFVDLLLRADVDGICETIERLRATGVTLDHIYVEHLAPAAVRLNQISGDGLCTSTEAALAFCNLQIVLRRYADQFCAEGRHDYSGLRALLVSAGSDGSDGAGLQVFGLVLAAEFFRREGWDVWIERGIASEPFRDVVRTQWFDMVEVIATDDRALDAIASGIKLIRRAAPNPRAAVIACGRVFEERPECVRAVGADRYAADALESLPQARNLVTHATRCQRLP